MIPFHLPNLETSPPPEVPQALFQRHLGLPPGAKLDEPLARQASASRRWFARYGKTWTRLRPIGITAIAGGKIHLANRLTLSSRLLAQGFREARVRWLVVLAVSAGAEVETRIHTLWQSERPDQAMMLAALAIATVEHLRDWHIDQLRIHLKRDGFNVLPHYSPGYDGWDLTDQAHLYQLIRASTASAAITQGHETSGAAGPLKLLNSCLLKPVQSTLAAIGITRSHDINRPCPFDWDQIAQRKRPSSTTDIAPSPQYAIPSKTLAKWARERLELTPLAEGRLRATFRLDGNTCTNMGLPLAFVYRIELSRDAAHQYRIDHCDCQPVENDHGYEAMCAYEKLGDGLLQNIRSGCPLIGKPLNSALEWEFETTAAGCLCTHANQNHKWRMVLQTLHYKLSSREAELEVEPESITDLKESS